MNTLTLIMAGISLLFSIFFSCFTIYMTFLRPAKLKIYVGPFILISRQSSYFAFTIPTAIANNSNQTGIIKRCTLVVTHIDTPQKNYHILWGSLRKLMANGKTWIQSDIVSTIAVIAKSTENRNIEFAWHFDSKPDIQFREGTYQLQLFFWANKTKPVAYLKHEIYLKAEHANLFNNPNIMGKIIQISMDNDLNVNEMLTSKQVERLKK